MSIWMVDFLKSGTIFSLSQNQLLIGWGTAQYKEAKARQFDQPAFYHTDFFLKKSAPWIQYSHWQEIAISDFLQQLNTYSSFPSSLPQWETGNFSQFNQIFNALRQELQTGKLEKAVPYLFARSSTQMNALYLKHALTHAVHSLAQNSGYLYGFWNAQSGLLGVTPETLFCHRQSQPKQVHTMALAGTSQAKDCPEIFKKNEKEQHEHRIVVEGIQEVLQALGKVKTGTLQVLQLPGLSHLMTPIEVNLYRSFHFEELVQCLHPTPALGVFPRQAGKKWLEQYQQKVDRHYYGAPIGFIYPSQGLSLCLVGIRNVQWNAQGLSIGAGCGIVKESVLEQEWQEIQLKIHATRQLIGFA